MEQSVRLTEINIFPLKSARKTSLQCAVVDRFGLQHDRRWMVVDKEGMFMTARAHPILSMLDVELLDNAIVLNIKGSSALTVICPDNKGVGSRVKVWSDEVDAYDAGIEAAEWLQKLLGEPCRLVFMTDDTQRQVDRDYAEAGVMTSFADGFPLLLIGQASLSELNDRLDQPVSMDRFRPNLVVSTDQPFVEDKWKKIRIGDVVLSLVKPCGRCIMVTVDPDTGSRGKEPLKTLASYRRQGKEVMFGQNLIHHNHGEISLGQEVEVLEWS